MRKYHPLSLVGLILGSGAGILLWAYLLNEGLTSATGEPLIFVGLLIIVAIAIIVSWAKPAVGPLLFVFAGVMLSTYSASTANRYQLLSSLILGVPFIITALLIYSGNAIRDRKNSSEKQGEQDE